jgi:hypothetical protein
LLPRACSPNLLKLYLVCVFVFGVYIFQSIVAPLLNQLAHLFEPSTSTEAEDASASSLILRFLSFLFHVPAALFSLVFTHRQVRVFLHLTCTDSSH